MVIRTHSRVMVTLTDTDIKTLLCRMLGKDIRWWHQSAQSFSFFLESDNPAKEGEEIKKHLKELLK